MAPLSWRAPLSLGLLVLFIACAQAKDEGSDGEAGGGEGGTEASEGGSGGSAGKGGSSAGKGGSDAGKGGSSAGSEAAGSGGSETAGTSSGGAPAKLIDSALSLPPPSAAICKNEGQTGGDCNNQFLVCRIYGTEEGRCEGCSPCGKPGDSCDASVKCGLESQCYAGTCREYCILGDPNACKGGGKCKDVGNESAGVCVP